MEPPKLVRLRKLPEQQPQQQTSLDGLCDVYIGPRIYNSNWNLPRSIFYNPYQNPLIPDAEIRLKAYRRRLEKKLQSESSFRERLLSLAGKKLGCFCDDAKQCHGSVLIEIVCTELGKKGKAFTQKPDHFETAEIFFFKGSSCPLSNLYTCDLHYEGNRFTSLEQLRLYRLASKGKVAFLQPIILKADHPHALSQASIQVHEQIDFSNSSFSIFSTFAWKLKEMLELIRIKWKQVSAFREMVLKNNQQQKVSVEATTSKFWGCGVDLDHVTPNTDFWTLPGCNHLGWIITRVLYEHLYGATQGLLRLQTADAIFTAHHGAMAEETGGGGGGGGEKRIPVVIRGLRNVISLDPV